MSSSVISESASDIVKATKERKTLPVKYKAMLYTCLSFIHNHVESPELRNDLFAKLPLYKSIEEQIAYFDENADIKKVEVTIYKPMIQENKKKIKAENAPVKEKKPRAPRKIKTTTVEEVVVLPPPIVQENLEQQLAEPELEFEQVYPDARPNSAVVEKEPEKKVETEKELEKEKEPEKKVEKEKKPKKEKEKKEKKPETENETVDTEKVKVKKPRAAPRKKKEESAAVPEVKEIVVKEPEELYMVPSDVISDGVFWTSDEDYKNGKLYASSEYRDDENNGVGKLVGKLVDGIPIFDNI